MPPRSRIVKRACGLLFVFLLSALAPLHAGEPFEGIWATTKTDCRDNDAPTSRTLIDLRNVIDGQPSPMFDQYENHCRIKRTTAGSYGAVDLAATCFSFWDDFTKDVDGKAVTIKLFLAEKNALTIDGKSYKRCVGRRERKTPR